MPDTATTPEDPRFLPHFPVHCEMQDAAAKVPLAHALSAPAAASIDLAKLLSRFETDIDDEWRASLIALGGALLKLAAEVDKPRG